MGMAVLAGLPFSAQETPGPEDFHNGILRDPWPQKQGGGYREALVESKA